MPSPVPRGKLFKIAVTFRYEVNSQGLEEYRSLVPLHQGDGVNFYQIQNITAATRRAGRQGPSGSYGMGGALLNRSIATRLKVRREVPHRPQRQMAQSLQKSENDDVRIGKASKGGRFNYQNGKSRHRRSNQCELIHSGNDLEQVDRNGANFADQNSCRSSANSATVLTTIFSSWPRMKTEELKY